MLITRRTFPPGGFEFFQTETGWHAPGGLTFEQVVDAIIKHRAANPRFAAGWSLDRTDVGNELDTYTCVRIAQNANYCKGADGSPFVQDTSGNPRPIVSPESLSGRVAAAASKLAAGVATIGAWRGAGGEVVPQEEAERRAAICAACFLNDNEHGIGYFFVSSVAASIQHEIERKNDIKLRTARDSELGVCKACFCCLRLKVFTPMEYITRHMSKSVTLPPRCWIAQ